MLESLHGRKKLFYEMVWARLINQFRMGRLLPDQEKSRVNGDRSETAIF
jgi:hypothetical protein